MKTLKLFNSVVEKVSNQQIYVSEQGFVIESGALWAKKQIIKFFKEEKLDGFGLNKTFHKSWRMILNSTRSELFLEQIRHYLSTYGSDFSEEVYIPNEILEIPDQKVKFKVIKGISKSEMIEKCLDLLKSGMALKQETVEDVLTILFDELSYKIQGDEGIKNKEAIIMIADIYGVLPNDSLDFLRYIIYRATGNSLLIKSTEVIETIKSSSYNPAIQFEKFGLEKLAEHFNRFKPLFLAFKNKCPKTINKISKMSKKYHKPMISNPLNSVTSLLISKQDEKWLCNATPFALFKALSACKARMNGQYAFTYRIRNGKSYIKSNSFSGVVWPNYDFILQHCKKRFNFVGKKFYFPKDVELALPTSEKMYVGNIPTGTKFFGESLAVGIYWENSWGARDLDLSGLNIGGKVGWNSSYKQGKGELMYSGDMTNASNGAVEYLHARNGFNSPTLIKNNVFAGKSDCRYKIIVGKGDHIDRNYMMNPNNLFVETACESVQKETILGLLLPNKNYQCFVILNFGAGSAKVSGNCELSKMASKALYQQWKDALTLKELILELGGELTDDSQNAHYDFSLSNLQKDSIIKVFEERV